MTDLLNDLHRLVREIDIDSKESIDRLIDRLSPYINRTIRRSFNQSMRSKFDTADFAQFIWLSFFSNLTVIKSLDEPAKLISYISKVAETKVVEKMHRPFLTDKRNVNLERSLDERMENGLEQQSSLNTPSQKFMAQELLDRLRRNLSVRDQQILSFKILGFSKIQIAEKLDISERTVRRVLDKMEEASIDERPASES